MRWCESKTDDLKLVIERIIEEIAMHSSCIVFITDPAYRGLIDMRAIKMSSFLLRYDIGVRDNDNFSRPRKKIVRALQHVKATGCYAYIILISNGLLASRFLQYAEGERLINTRGYFLLLHDNRLFRPELHYIWNRIINVVFIRRYNTYKYRSGERVTEERIDLNTVYYPSYTRDFTTIKYIDTWQDGKLRYGNNHYIPKTTNLHGNGLRIAVFEHIPAVTEASRDFYDESTTTASPKALGIEFELIRIIAKAMNFKTNYYMPSNIANERWGKEGDNDSYTGLLGEAITENADFFLGDLHYTLDHLNYFDLSTPYISECLTFLTPEALTDNSWKLLILPFRLNTWIALLCTLLLAGGAFHVFALLYQKYIDPCVSVKYNEVTDYDSMKGLYLFTQFQNSMLYTYSMLLQVSLPRLPNALTVQIFIGWWWIYSILASVTYRASMTATLSHPIAKVTIDTLAQLTRSSLAVGGWNEKSKDFFLASSDPHSQEIGNKFELIENEKNAIDRVANGKFCYYENSYLLQHARGKYIFEKQNDRQNMTEKSTDSSVKYNLHIMEECVVHMPIALGLEKNSPLKPHVDLWVRRMTEIGLVRKWLSDVMEWSKINESRQKSESETLVNLRKLRGAFIALGIGHFLGFIVLIGEILHWRYVVLRDPKYDKYHLDAFYRNNNKFKT
ncbi:PREDICTED: probable glutamate receptor isoform X2 [Wasmannia auropunctata]|nr:PREDICTED: probable glutamate receptor isoform X2 [Wasmannia auropunctata]XP_011698468.1 PREDICTED: probable glutamate receptor isoform X2 [Wasmannia auropunctata]XP_011698469.1 PREDICTED: probable glutamate receptor isoform X2 [Wasmannia auropunctata]XP_011698470.1 PREDICTED: probable glutamate receptor isoform X2 [Wasmannia auropunctata]